MPGRRHASARRIAGLALLLLGGGLVCAGACARAADQTAPAAVALEGRFAHPGSVTLADLQRLPLVTITLDDPEHAPHRRTYAGVLLWTLVTQAGPIDEPGRKTHLRHTLLATGRDGYGVALSIGEIDPAFEGKQVIVAYSQDGSPLQAPRLVVPNDRKAGRAVRDLVAIDMR